LVDVTIEPRPSKRATIEAFYRALDAPEWAAANLDGLADILRDLSWRPVGPIRLQWRVDPDLPLADLDAIHDVVASAVVESARSPHPLSMQVLG
jgi:hypothetical protein